MAEEFAKRRFIVVTSGCAAISAGRVYIRGINNFLKTKHELNMEIDQAFRRHEIEIAFPQRDLHLRSVDRPIPIVSMPHEPPDPERKGG